MYNDNNDMIEEISLEEAEKMGLSADQRDIFDTRDYSDENVDERLAEIIYKFLNAKSNSMPTPEFVAKVDREAVGETGYGDAGNNYRETVIISRGYGVEVTRNREVKISRMDNPTEVYVITPEEYYRLSGISDKKVILVEKDNEGGYDLGRVSALQNVLANSREISSEKKY